MREFLQDPSLSNSSVHPALFYTQDPLREEEKVFDEGLIRKDLERNAVLTECIGVIIQNIDNPKLGVDLLSRKMFMSHSSLYKKLKELVGLSINELIRHVRLEYASLMLVDSNCRINEVAYRAGFNNVKYFRKQFKKLYEQTPTAYRNRESGIKGGLK